MFGRSMRIFAQLDQQYDEFISSQTGNRISLSTDHFKPMSCLHQQRITDIVPQGVINAFEMIQIQKHHCQKTSMATVMS